MMELNIELIKYENINSLTFVVGTSYKIFTSLGTLIIYRFNLKYKIGNMGYIII